MALGEALATTGRTDGALREYNLAALALEHATLSIPEDLDRARYRERNLFPFDGAIRLLLASDRRPRRTDELVRWMSRRMPRRSRSLCRAGRMRGRARTARDRDSQNCSPGSTPSELLVSYIVLDSAVWALAIGNAEVKLVRVPINAARLSARVAEIRRPLVNDILRPPGHRAFSVCHEGCGRIVRGAHPAVR